MNALSHFWYRFKFRHGKNLPLSVPVDVSLELSSFCTNQCSYCYHSEPKELPFKRGHMTKEMAFDIIRQSSDLGVNSLKFNYRGEPTLNPHFSAITKYARDLARGSTFIDRITNSNFNFNIGRTDIFEGLSALTKLKVSFDSFRPEVFHSQRVGSNLEKTIANVNTFYNSYLTEKTELVIQAVRTHKNQDEDLEGEIKKRWPSATASIRDVVAGRTQKKEYDTTRARGNNRQPCQQAFVRIIFHHDGVASPCCPSIKGDLRIGDINKSNVYDIFNSYWAKQIRRDLKSGHAFEFDPCRTCSSFESYKGFRPSWQS